jgi:hypothetical protein
MHAQHTTLKYVYISLICASLFRFSISDAAVKFLYAPHAPKIEAPPLGLFKVQKSTNG